VVIDCVTARRARAAIAPAAPTALNRSAAEQSIADGRLPLQTRWVR
jgi:hypothetical protein